MFTLSTYKCIQNAQNQEHGIFVQKKLVKMLTNFVYQVKLYVARFRRGESLSEQNIFFKGKGEEKLWISI